MPNCNWCLRQDSTVYLPAKARRVAVLCATPVTVPLDLALRARLYQASSATAIPLSETPWKRLEVLPGQTVLESALIACPRESRDAVPGPMAGGHE